MSPICGFDRSEHRVGVHHDLVRASRSGAAAHRVVRHEHGHFPLRSTSAFAICSAATRESARRVQVDSIAVRGRVADGGASTASESSMLMLPATGRRKSLALPGDGSPRSPGTALALELASAARAAGRLCARPVRKQDDDREQQPERGAREIREVL